MYDNDVCFCMWPKWWPFSAGLLAHAQRALAVATIGNTHDCEKQLQRVSLQVSCTTIHVLIAYLPLLQHSGDLCDHLPNCTPSCFSAFR